MADSRVPDQHVACDDWRVAATRDPRGEEKERGDARVEETRTGGREVRAKRAYAWGQLGPTRLTAAENDTWHALVSSRGSTPIGSAQRTAG